MKEERGRQLAVLGQSKHLRLLDLHCAAVLAAHAVAGVRASNNQRRMG